MKKLPPLLASILYTAVAQAQFYAPETDFHDFCQRTFPVEAARVLAWQQGGGAGGIAEVTWQLENAPAHESVWHIQWLGADKKVRREKTVRYPESLLAEGPKYFREVFQQLCGDDWKPRGAPSRDYAAAFWEGAKLAGVSRTEAIGAAGKLVTDKPRLDQAGDAAKLAGILIHAAMPSTASRLTIDSMFLARAAAWLCTAENLSPDHNDALWAPLLALVWRDKAAHAAWQQAAPRPALERQDAERYWDFYLHGPSVKDCFLFAAHPENRQFAMPAMIFPHQFDLAWTGVLVDVSGDVFGPEVLGRLFEYGPNISIRGAVAGGNWGAQMPGLAMAAWVRALREFHPSDLDYTGYQQPMKAMLRSGQQGLGDLLADLAPLLNLGLDEGRGPLIPMAWASSRDLLGYGWEMAGIQFGYTYNHLENMLGDHPTASLLANACLTNLKGIEVYFTKPKVTPKYPLDDLRRLQFVHSSMVQRALLKNPPGDWKGQPEILFRRCWLAMIENIALEQMIQGNAPEDEIKAMIERLRREGGPLAFGSLINRDGGAKFPKLIDRLNLRASLTAELPWALHARSEAIRDAFKGKNDPLGYAQALEKLGWENISFDNFQTIFFQYLEANADTAAKRFYDEVLPFVTNQVAFSNFTGPARYTLAWVEHDEAAEARVLKDIETYSFSELLLRVTNFALHGDGAHARQVLNAIQERYPESNARTQALKDFLPLLPALLDPRQAGHGKALEAFPADDGWQFLRWALATQAKLPADDVARLMKSKTDEIFVAAVRGDKQRFEELYKKNEFSTLAWVPATHLHWQMTSSAPPANQPDLRPPGVHPLHELVHEEQQRLRK